MCNVLVFRSFAFCNTVAAFSLIIRLVEIRSIK